MIAAARPMLTGTPVLETERLVLRGPQPTDWPAFRDYRRSERTVFTGGPKKEPEAAQQFASFFGHWAMRGFGRFIAEDRKTRQPLGHFGPMQWQDGAIVELTWSLWTADAEGKGLSTEAARATVSWAFGTLGLPEARAEVHRDNLASHRIAVGVGGQPVADQRPTWFDSGTVYRFDARGFA